MIRGLLLKTLHEVWAPTLLFGAALGLVMALLTSLLPHLQEGLNDFLPKLPFVKNLLQSLLGTTFGADIGATMMQALVWVHPVVLALVWGHEIVFCTRVPAGEIDRGTIDILLGLPVSRRAVYLADSLAWLTSGAAILSIGLAGHLWRVGVVPESMSPTPRGVVLVLVNLYCVYVAVGGAAYLVSAFSSHRGRAVAVIFAIVLGSFLLNFLSQFWYPAKHVAFLSVLDYYRPAQVLRETKLPWRDVTTLLTFGFATWLAGCEVFTRRSVCTV